MLLPTEVVAQFRDYGLTAELREGVPFCPLDKLASIAYVRSVLKCCEGMGLGAALFAEGAVITPGGGASMHLRMGETVIPKGNQLYRGSGAERIRRV